MSIFTSLPCDSRYLISPKMMAKEEGKKHRSLDRSFCFFSGVRGMQYFLDNFQKIDDSIEFVNLVPEPENDADCNAIAVYAGDKKLGYVSASAAEYLHAVVALKIHESGECWVPVSQPETHSAIEPANTSPMESLRKDPTCRIQNVRLKNEYGSSYYHFDYSRRIGIPCLPTIRGVRYLIPDRKLFAYLDNIWDQMSDSTIDEIRQEGWRLNESSIQEFRSLAGTPSDYPFIVSPPTEDSLLIHYLVHYRRIIYKLGQEREFAKRNMEILSSSLAGESNTKLAQKYGLSPNTISSIKKMAKGKRGEEWRSILEIIPATEKGLRRRVITHELGETPTLKKIEKWALEQ